jgi:hypothetical protein
MATSDSIQRLAAEIRMGDRPSDPVAHCEECGVPIPIEYARCANCEYDERDEADQRFECEREGE